MGTIVNDVWPCTNCQLATEIFASFSTNSCITAVPPFALGHANFLDCTGTNPNEHVIETIVNDG